VAWTPSGEQFIVISGTQPATATLYDKDATPLFEFGKKFRNTIRVCPFSQIVMIGGFGSLDGEMDFWELASMKLIGKAKDECAVGIDWAPDGLNLMTSVLYELVKVDNTIKFFSGAGKKVTQRVLQFNQLIYSQWQPRPTGYHKKPDISHIKKEAAAEEAKKPKKVFMMPGGSNDAFA
jgi:translation initiation factor 2A